MRSIYLDYNSTTPVASSVRDCILPFLSEFYGHPSSSHWQGRASQEAIEDARSSLATLLGCHPAEIVFTSGGTESINLALLGTARSISLAEPELTPHIVTTVLEHAATQRCIEQLEQQGWEVSIADCDNQGVVIADRIERLMRENTRLVNVIHANHHIGTIQPLARIAELCEDRNVLFHSDAAQSVGKIQCNVDELGVDLLSLSGHKFYAPKGIGALYVRLGVSLEPVLCGDGNEGGLRPGTQNVSHIVALGQAAKLALQGMESAADRLAELRDRFHAQLEHLLGIAIPVHGSRAARLPNSLSFEIPRTRSLELQRQIPEICFGPILAPIPAIGSGSAYSAYSAIGLDTERISNSYRISLGWQTSEQEIEQSCQMIAAAYESLSL